MHFKRPALQKQWYLSKIRRARDLVQAYPILTSDSVNKSEKETDRMSYGPRGKHAATSPLQAGSGYLHSCRVEILF